MRALRYALALILLAAATLWAFGPYEPDDLSAQFDPAAFNNDIPAYFADEESRFPDIRSGTEKRVIWAGAPGEKTAIALVCSPEYQMG